MKGAGLGDIRQYVRLEAILIVVVAACMLGVCIVGVQSVLAHNKAGDMEEQRARVQADLDLQREVTSQLTADLATKQQYLEVIREGSRAQRALTSVGTLTSFDDAKALSTRLINYAEEQEVVLVGFEADRGLATIDDFELTAFTYTITARGLPHALIGMLTLAGDVRTARVETLELARETSAANQWNMTLGVVVPYGAESE